MEKIKKLALVAESGGNFQLAGSAGISNGVRCQRFVKDIMKCGTYRHPKKGWTLDVTPERMDRWVASSKAMAKNGVDCEVVTNHSSRAEDVYGKGVDMFRDGNTLFAAVDIVGEEGIDLAQRCPRVSVLMEPDFKDGLGNNYGEAITHISIVQQPVVPDQGPFVPIAASFADSMNADIEPFVLSSQGSESEQKKTQEKTTMDIKLDDIKALIGAGDDLTEENAMARLADHFKTAAESKAKSDKDILDLKAQVDSLTKKAASMQDGEGNSIRTVDPDVLDGLAELGEQSIQALADQNKVTPACAASLKNLLVGPADNRNAYALSRNVSGTSESILRQVVKILQSNNVVELGAKTKEQTKEFSRVTPGEDGKPPEEKVKKQVEKYVEMAGGKNKKK